MIPAEPSGENLAEGLVITSILSIEPAGICWSTCPRLSAFSPAGLPLIQISTSSELRSEIVPCWSTSTEGIFSNTSVTLAPADAISWLTVNTFRSNSKRIELCCATTSTSSNACVSSLRRMRPNVTSLSCTWMAMRSSV